MNSMKLNKRLLLVVLAVVVLILLVSCGKDKSADNSESIIMLIYDAESNPIETMEDYAMVSEKLKPYLTEACQQRVFANRIFGSAHAYSLQNGVAVSVDKVNYEGEVEKYGRKFRYYHVNLNIGSESGSVDFYIDISKETDYKADYVLIENSPF